MGSSGVKNGLGDGLWRGGLYKSSISGNGPWIRQGCVRESPPLRRIRRDSARFGRFAGRGLAVLIIRPAPEVWTPGRERRDARAHGCSQRPPYGSDTESGARPGVALGGNRPSQQPSYCSADQSMTAAGLRLPHLGIARPAYRTPWPKGRAGAAARELRQRGVVDRTAGRLTGTALVGAGIVSRVRAARHGN